MARDLGALTGDLEAAIAPELRGKLLARGQAQSMIRRDGVLPEDAPQFDNFLDEDLLGYGYSLLSTGLRTIEAIDHQDGEATGEGTRLARKAFLHASFALESATRNAGEGEELTFHRLIAGAASHLAGYDARAFSLVSFSTGSKDLSPIELTLADLIMRRLGDIEDRTRAFRTSPQMTDEALVASVVAGDEASADSDGATAGAARALGPIALLLSENYMVAVATALFALAQGQREQFDKALASLDEGQQASMDISEAGPWWVYRLSRLLVDDLWDTSIRQNIPSEPPPYVVDAFDGDAEECRTRWRTLRGTLIENLFARKRSEINLWPSQLHVVDRIFRDDHDLIVALPTSAGKTRIAELCILACLAEGRRTVFVTPLRALSAQTERILNDTFAPLGVRVSSLYGSMGVSNTDEDALRHSQIVVATPEKLDFALRSDPTILDDVGLVVLDEGHMIGPSERDIHYEAQIQRLRRRADAASRRIVCLSAVFPPGEDLDDFVAWISDDTADSLHKEEWRPTQQRFGLVEWRGDHARLSITGEVQTYIPRYLESKPAKLPRRKPFPSSQSELVVATAWRLVEEGQTALIFCPLRKSVETYASGIVKLHRQRFIDSVLPPGVDLTEALATGAEWFGTDHPILECLKLGVAIHHGALPGPFRREVERLLHDGKSK